MAPLRVTIDSPIALVELHRPEKANALDTRLWEMLGETFRELDEQSTVRVCVLSGAGKHFCAGIDLEMLQQLGKQTEDFNCEGRKRDALRRTILKLQSAFTEIERCRKPVIATVHGACLGAGLDLVAACDLRYCTTDASFQIKEIDLGLVADIGSLQRLPALIAQGMVRELAFTGRVFSGEEAQRIGLVNQCFPDHDVLMRHAREVSERIASKSPLAVTGIKETLLYARDHTVAEGLSQVANWNAAMLLSNDLEEVVMASLQNRSPQFQD